MLQGQFGREDAAVTGAEVIAMDDGLYVQVSHGMRVRAGNLRWYSSGYKGIFAAA